MHSTPHTQQSTRGSLLASPSLLARSPPPPRWPRCAWKPPGWASRSGAAAAPSAPSLWPPWPAASCTAARPVACPAAPPPRSPVPCAPAARQPEQQARQVGRLRMPWQPHQRRREVPPLCKAPSRQPVQRSSHSADLPPLPLPPPGPPTVKAQCALPDSLRSTARRSAAQWHASPQCCATHRPLPLRSCGCRSQ